MDSQYQKYSFGKLSGEIFSSEISPFQTNELWTFKLAAEINKKWIVNEVKTD